MRFCPCPVSSGPAPWPSFGHVRSPWPFLSSWPSLLSRLSATVVAVSMNPSLLSPTLTCPAKRLPLAITPRLCILLSLTRLDLSNLNRRLGLPSATLVTSARYTPPTRWRRMVTVILLSNTRLSMRMLKPSRPWSRPLSLLPIDRSKTGPTRNCRWGHPVALSRSWPIGPEMPRAMVAGGAMRNRACLATMVPPPRWRPI